MYVLIITAILLGNGVSIETQEFATFESCNTAGKFWLSNIPNRRGFYDVVGAYNCVVK